MLAWLGGPVVLAAVVVVLAAVVVVLAAVVVVLAAEVAVVLWGLVEEQLCFTNVRHR